MILAHRAGVSRHKLIGDNAYESDRLDADLARRGVELIARTAEREHRGPKTVAPCVATDGGASRYQNAIRLAVDEKGGHRLCPGFDTGKGLTVAERLPSFRYGLHTDLAPRLGRWLVASTLPPYATCRPVDVSWLQLFSAAQHSWRHRPRRDRSTFATLS